jgi:hypothetical protein
MKTYNLGTFVKGNTFNGITFTMLLNNVGMDLTHCTIKSMFREGGKNGTSVKTITNGAGITITDAVNGIFTIDPFTVNFDIGTYVYDIQMTFIDKVETYINGNIVVITSITN